MYFFFTLLDKNSFLFCNTIKIGKIASMLLFILISYVYLLLFLEVQEDIKNMTSSQHNILRHPLRMLDGSCPSTKNSFFYIIYILLTN
jgi:hypothetical protein